MSPFKLEDLQLHKDQQLKNQRLKKVKEEKNVVKLKEKKEEEEKQEEDLVSVKEEPGADADKNTVFFSPQN